MLPVFERDLQKRENVQYKLGGFIQILRKSVLQTVVQT